MEKYGSSYYSNEIGCIYHLSASELGSRSRFHTFPVDGGTKIAIRSATPNNTAFWSRSQSQSRGGYSFFEDNEALSDPLTHLEVEIGSIFGVKYEILSVDFDTTGVEGAGADV